MPNNPTNRINNLLSALSTSLTAVTVGGATPFDRIKKASDLEDGYIVKVPETQVLTQQDLEWDGENPELGEQRIHLDLFTRDVTQKAGENQIISDTGLNHLVDAVREQANHFSGGPFGAATTLVAVAPPIREDAGNKVFRYRMRLIYEVLWG